MKVGLGIIRPDHDSAGNADDIRARTGQGVDLKRITPNHCFALDNRIN